MAKFKPGRPKAVVDGKELVEKPKHHLPKFTRKNKIIGGISLVILSALLGIFIAIKIHKPDLSKSLDPSTLNANGGMSVDQLISAWLPQDPSKLSKDKLYGAYFMVAEYYLSKSDGMNALKYLAKAQAAKPSFKDPNLYFVYGQAYEQTANKAKALESYQASTKICQQISSKASICDIAKTSIKRLGG